MTYQLPSRLEMVDVRGVGIHTAGRREVRGSGFSIFTDPEDFQSSMPIPIELVVLQPGPFRASVTRVELPHLRLLHVQETLPRVAYLSLPSRDLFTTFPTHKTSSLICNGIRVQLGEILFHSRGERFHQRVTAASSWGVISLAPSSFVRYGQILVGRDLTAPTVCRILHPDPAEQRRLLRLHAQAARIAETALNHLIHPQVARALDQDMLLALTACLSADEAEADITREVGRDDILVRLEELIANGAHFVPSISQLGEALGVSERRLRSRSSRVLGITITRYLYLRKLKRVRQALDCSNEVMETIDRVTSEFGFARPELFVKAYQKAFGTKPFVST